MNGWGEAIPIHTSCVYQDAIDIALVLQRKCVYSHAIREAAIGTICGCPSYFLLWNYDVALSSETLPGIVASQDTYVAEDRSIALLNHDIRPKHQYTRSGTWPRLLRRPINTYWIEIVITHEQDDTKIDRKRQHKHCRKIS